MTYSLAFALASVLLSIPSQASPLVCEDAINAAAKSIHVVTPPPCNPIDPACAALNKASGRIGLGQAGVLECGRKAGLARCPEYRKLLDGGQTDSAAWSKSMSSCSRSIDEIHSSYFGCLCPHPEKTPPQLEATPPPSSPTPSKQK